MLLQHELVVHLVDMIARKHDHVFGFAVANDVDVLIDRVRRARVPLAFGNPLTCRKNVETLVASRAEKVPAAREVANQTVRLVLRGDADAADARVQGIGKREVDDPRLAAEIDRRLGPPVGQLEETAAAPASENKGHGLTPDRRTRSHSCFSPGSPKPVCL